MIAVFAEYPRKRNRQVTILMTSREDVAYPLHKQIQVVAIGKSTDGSLIKRLKRVGDLRKRFRQDKEQIVFFFGTETNLFTLMAGIGLKNRIIISERNDPNQCRYAALRNLLYRMADKLVFQTEDARLCFPKKIANRGVVIPNSLMEAMALGVPMIFIDCPIGRSQMLIQDKDNGLLTPVGRCSSG